MDYLVKQNIIKKNKTIVDVGHKYIKLLAVNYSSKKITVTGVQKQDSGQLFRTGELNYAELVRSVESVTGSKKRMELSLSLPADMAEYKIVGIKNKKITELRTHVEKEYSFSGKVSPVTHEIDYAYLGSREENGDSIHYCMIGAVSKSSIYALTDEFEKHKMKVTTVTFPVYDLICLSQLFNDDYKNKLMIDFGVTGTRIAAVCDGVPVYVRNINIGFQTYIDKLFTAQEQVGRPEILDMVCTIGEMRILTGDHITRYFTRFERELYFSVMNEVGEALAREIFRVAELCENNNAPVTKIICNDYPVKGFEQRLKAGNMEAERFDLSLSETALGKDFILQLGNVNADASYNNALGLAVHTLL